MGFLSVCLSQGCWGGVKITPCLKLINIVLEIEVWYLSTNTSITYSGKAPLILLKSEFVLQKSPFLGKTKIFWLCFNFLVDEVLFLIKNKEFRTMHLESGFYIAPDWWQIRKMTMTP